MPSDLLECTQSTLRARASGNEMLDPDGVRLVLDPMMAVSCAQLKCCSS